MRAALLLMLLWCVMVCYGDTEAWDELRAAVVTSQLALSQNTLVLQELLNFTRSNNNVHLKEPICPPPYTQVVDECFYLSPASLKLAWLSARQHCQGMGGDLATPENVYAVKSFILERGGSGRTWIGGTDVEEEQVWKYVDNRTITGWATGQPDDWMGGQDCATVTSYSHPPLDDAECNMKARFVCQYRSKK